MFESTFQNKKSLNFFVKTLDYRITIRYNK
nr:MAG TPA: hypothetical protein [Caudoviricetes sp.]